jgi:hypothetical protein
MGAEFCTMEVKGTNRKDIEKAFETAQYKTKDGTLATLIGAWCSS